MLYRAAEGTPPKSSIKGTTHTTERACKIEVLGAGNQFVAFGEHWSGGAIHWFRPPSEEPIENLTALTEDRVHEMLRRCAAIIGGSEPQKANGHDHEPTEPQADPVRIAAALADIANQGAPDWEDWNRVGMAVWAATGGSDAGWQALDAWSAKNGAYDALRTRQRWDHYFTSPPSRIGAGTIFHMAEEVRLGRLSMFRPRPSVEGSATPTAPAPKLILTLAELDALRDPEWLLQGIIPEGSLVVPYGPPKAGKSFILLSQGLHIAAGKDWFGMAVKAGAVVYIAGEGVGGLEAAGSKAMRQAYGIGSDIPFWIVRRAVNFRLKEEVEALIALVRDTIQMSPFAGDTRCPGHH